MLMSQSRRPREMERLLGGGADPYVYGVACEAQHVGGGGSMSDELRQGMERLRQRQLAAAGGGGMADGVQDAW